MENINTSDVIEIISVESDKLKKLKKEFNELKYRE